MPDTEPWTLDHQITWFAQVRTLDSRPDSDGARWRETEHTGLVLAVCNCGLNTGWIPKADMPDQATLVDGEQHARLTTQSLTRARRVHTAGPARDRHAVADWLTANGINPDDVPLQSWIETGTRPDGTEVIRYTAFQREQGHIVAGDDGGPVTEQRETPLTVEWTAEPEEEAPCRT
ncbi:hypothetical protein ACWFRQ_17705 [Streptomyces niveus]